MLSAGACPVDSAVFANGALPQEPEAHTCKVLSSLLCKLSNVVYKSTARHVQLRRAALVSRNTQGAAQNSGDLRVSAECCKPESALVVIWVRVQLFWQHHLSLSKWSANAVAMSRLHESTDSLHSGNTASGLGMNAASVLQTLGCFPAWKDYPSMYLQRRDCTRRP